MNFEFRDVQKWHFFICWKHVTAWIILLFYDFIRPHVEMLIRSVYDWCVKFLSSFGSHGLVEEVFLPVYINKNLIFFVFRVGAFFFIIMNQIFGNLSALELFIKERSIFMYVAFIVQFDIFSTIVIPLCSYSFYLCACSSLCFLSFSLSSGVFFPLQSFSIFQFSFV